MVLGLGIYVHEHNYHDNPCRHISSNGIDSCGNKVVILNSAVLNGYYGMPRGQINAMSQVRGQT